MKRQTKEIILLNNSVNKLKIINFNNLISDYFFNLINNCLQC